MHYLDQLHTQRLHLAMLMKINEYIAEITFPPKLHALLNILGNRWQD